MSRRHSLLAVSVLAAAVTAALTLTPGASAEAPCWEKVYRAWSQSDLKANFPIRCYETAVSKLPADLRGYSSAADDIKRAMLAAIRTQAANRSTASVKHGTSKADGSRSALGVTPTSHGRHASLPLPLVILVGWLVVVAASLPFIRRGRRARKRS